MIDTAKELYKAREQIAELEAELKEAHVGTLTFTPQEYRKAIEAIRKFNRGEITRDELNAVTTAAYTAAHAKWEEIEQLFIKHFGEKER